MYRDARIGITGVTIAVRSAQVSEQGVAYDSHGDSHLELVDGYPRDADDMIGAAVGPARFAVGLDSEGEVRKPPVAVVGFAHVEQLADARVQSRLLEGFASEGVAQEFVPLLAAAGQIP